MPHLLLHERVSKEGQEVSHCERTRVFELLRRHLHDLDLASIQKQFIEGACLIYALLLLDLIDSLEYDGLKQHFAQIVVELLTAEARDTAGVTDDRVAGRSVPCGCQLIHHRLLFSFKLALVLIRRCLLEAVSNSHVSTKRAPLDRRH